MLLKKIMQIYYVNNSYVNNYYLIILLTLIFINDKRITNYFKKIRAVN